MMSRSKQQASNVESDSDWDSLPGDIPEQKSSPEPTKSLSPREPAYSPVPTPPKQPYSKHHTSTKPANMYKNSSHPVRSSGSATTFEDRTGGIWNEDERNEDIKVSVSKENNNNFKKNEVQKEKSDITAQTRKLESVEERAKKPPFTDFREALSSPIPAGPSMREQHEMTGVNKAYRIETGDETKTSHDSWDDSENESRTQPNTIPQSRMISKVTQRALPMDRSWETTPRQMPVDKTRFVEMPHQDPHSLRLNHASGNCCMIQISDAAFDDRNRPSFFHGSKNHFHIKKEDPRASITDIADKSEVIVQRFWREVFGALQIIINFFIIFMLELFKTIILSVRYLLTGILYTTGDHFIKPVLSAIFNNFVQPIFVFVLNVLTILGELLRPILALTREILGQVSIPLQAFRLFVWEYGGRNYHPI